MNRVTSSDGTTIAFDRSGDGPPRMTNMAGAPKSPLRLALVLREYEDEIYFVRPPLAIQRVIFGVLAKVGRLLGYRTGYPYARRSDACRTVA